MGNNYGWDDQFDGSYNDLSIDSQDFRSFGSLSTVKYYNLDKDKEEIKETRYTDEEIEAIKKECLKKKDRMGMAFNLIGLTKEKDNIPFKPMTEMEILEDHSITFDLGNTDPVLSGRRLYDRKSITLKPNSVTPLVGCNGAGKSTMIVCLEDIVRRNSMPYLVYDNLHHGAASKRDEVAFEQNFGALSDLLTQSEGENILYISTQELDIIKDALERDVKRDGSGKRYRENSHWFLFLDAIDSGFSIDNIININRYLDILVETAKQYNKYIYIIAAANSFELARNRTCWDVQHSKEIEFGSDYEKYRQFIVDSRNRILRQWKQMRENAKKPKEEETKVEQEKETNKEGNRKFKTDWRDRR